MLSFAPAPTPVFTGIWDHRPTISSPLSSSPIRATSPPSPLNDAASSTMRQIQSSPIPAPKFKFASRAQRSNPILRKREEKQMEQRRNFLQSVREKSEERAWKRRDIEGNFQKTSWLANLDQLTHDAPAVGDDDIEEAMKFEDEHLPPIPEDEIAMEEDYSTFDDQMVAAFESEQAWRPPSPDFSDDFDDSIFDDLIAQEEYGQQQRQAADEMEMN